MTASQDVNNERNPSIYYYLKQRTIMINLILMTIAWVVVAFNYYLATFMVKHIPGDFNINSLVMFSTDVPANLIVGWLGQKLPPRLTFTLCFGLQVVAGLSILLFVDQ